MEIPLYRPFIGGEGPERIREVLEEGWISQSGDTVREFEEEVGDFLGTGHGTAVDSGTAALQVALESLGVGNGDRVAVPGFTFGATAMAVKQAGATPVPVDVERGTLAVDPAELEEVVDSVSAVVVAHLFGQPARLGRITELAKAHGVPVVEDAAQAFGSEYKGRKVGTVGDVGCFSFSWNKTVTTGKGGFVVTGDPETASRVEEVADRDWERNIKSYNYRMDSLRAALGLSQLEKFQEIVRRKEKVVELYREGLREASGIQFPREEEHVEVVPWLFYVLSDERGSIQERLESEGISSRRFYPPIPDMAAFDSSRHIPVAREVSRRGLMLPTYPGMEEEEVERVAAAVADE